MSFHSPYKSKSSGLTKNSDISIFTTVDGIDPDTIEGDFPAIIDPVAKVKRVVRTNGDGNCFLYSLINLRKVHPKIQQFIDDVTDGTGLKVKNNSEPLASLMRTTILEYTTAHLERLTSTGVIPPSSIEGIFERMSNPDDREYLQEDDIKILASIMGVPIVVVNSKELSFDLPDGTSNIVKGRGQIVDIIRPNGKRFVSLFQETDGVLYPTGHRYIYMNRDSIIFILHDELSEHYQGLEAYEFTPIPTSNNGDPRRTTAALTDFRRSNPEMLTEILRQDEHESFGRHTRYTRKRRRNRNN